MLDIVINLLPWALLIIFGLFAVFVKEVRIVSSVIVISALANMAMAGVYEQGTTVAFLYKGFFDATAALALLLFCYFYEARKAPEQAIVFFLGMFSHGWLVYEVFAKEYWFYAHYDTAMLGLTTAHFLIMGDYYDELFKNIKKAFLARVYSTGYSRGFSNRLEDGKQRNGVLGDARRGRNMGALRSGSLDKKAQDYKESTGYNGS